MRKAVQIFCLLALLISQSPTTYAGKLVWKVRANGEGQFASIQAAIDKIPNGPHEFISIELEAGVYREKLFIKKTCATLN